MFLRPRWLPPCVWIHAWMCEHMSISFSSFSFSVSVHACVSHRNTYAQTHSYTHREHAMHCLRAVCWSKIGSSFPACAYTYMRTHMPMPLMPSGQSVQSKCTHTFWRSSMASRAIFLLVLFTFYPLGIQGWSIFCLFRTDFTLCRQCVLPVLRLFISATVILPLFLFQYLISPDQYRVRISKLEATDGSGDERHSKHALLSW